jgi:D,D-heptose 1,7-bisphosphate phosphatase
MNASSGRQAVVLVGGLGTRLGALTADVPKPMLPIGDRTFLSRLLEDVARHGFDEILLLCGHKSPVILDAFDGRVLRGARIRCLVEPTPLGTGGALRFALGALRETFYLFNGDSCFDFNILDLEQVGDGVPWLAKVALRGVEDTARYGRVSLRGEVVESFAEKGATGAGLINAGIYVLRREVVAAMPEGKCSLEADVFPRLAREGLLVARGYEGYFIDIGIPEDLEKARVEIPSRRRPAVFFDRDGVLNEDDGYTHKAECFRWVEGARRAVKRFNDAGWFVFVVTNQAGIARGFYGPEAVDTLHSFMQSELAHIGAHVDEFRFCPHHPEGSVPGLAVPCRCRKPEPGMLEALIAQWPIDIASSILIGDKASDIVAAEAAGVVGHRFRGGDLDAFVLANVRGMTRD